MCVCIYTGSPFAVYVRRERERERLTANGRVRACGIDIYALSRFKHIIPIIFSALRSLASLTDRSMRNMIKTLGFGREWSGGS